MKDTINWLTGWITVIVRITDLSFSYSYSKRREELEHKCMDHICIIGEIIFSDYKNIKKGEHIKISSFVDHDDEISGLDEKINPKDENGNWRSITIREWRKERDLYKCIGYLGKDRMHINTDDRFWDRYTLMKIHGKDIYLILDCKREKGKRPMVLSYRLENSFNIDDYE